MTKINVNENTTAEGQADIAPFLKYTFSSSVCPISNFNLNIKSTSKTKNDLAREYYNYINTTSTYNSEIFNSSIKNKTNDNLIKPVYSQVKFIGDNSNRVQFDYISLMTQLDENYKVLSHIANTINNEDFLDSTNLNIQAFQSLYSLQTMSRLDKSLSVISQPFNYSLGLYQQHEKIVPTLTSNFKVSINNFIYQTINNVFENKPINYQLFKDIFVKNDKLNSISISSLMLPNIIYEYQDQLYSYVPHASADIKINNFITSPAYNDNETTFKFIPEYYSGNNFSNDKKLKPTIWNYPFINVKVESTGKMSVNSQSMEDMSFGDPNLLFIDGNPSSIKYPTSHIYKTKIDLKKEIMIKKPDGLKTEEKEFDLSNKHYFTCVFKKNGYITYNPDKIGVYCKGAFKCNCEIGGGIGKDKTSDIYLFKYIDSNGREQTVPNIGEKNAPTGTFEAASTRGGQITNKNKYEVSPSSTAKISPKCVDVPSKYEGASHGCCKHKCKDESALWKYTKYDDLNTIKKNILNLGINFENPNEIKNCKKIDDLDKAINSARPYYTTTTKQTCEFKLGNALNQTQEDKIISSNAFTGNNKWYSSSFGALASDVYVYDDRFYYLVYKYFDANYKKICDVLVSEIINFFYEHPELLIVYRIQKGYLSYLLTKIENINPSTNLTLNFDGQKSKTVSKSACVLNLECPLIGAMVHSDTLNMTTYNDYISDSMDIQKISRIIKTNDGNVVLLNLPKSNDKNNIDTIYPNSITKFGNISSNNNVLPGIFVSDSANPLDFILGNSTNLAGTQALKIVDVNADNAQEKLNDLSKTVPGSLIVFDFDQIGSTNKYSENKITNDAISKAKGSKITQVFLPYTFLTKTELLDANGRGTGVIEFVFEYSTFPEKGINIIYYSKSETSTDKGNTYLERDSINYKNCFRYFKHYGGEYNYTHPVGRLVTNMNIN